MTVQLPTLPQRSDPLVDKEGRLTLAGYRYMEELRRAVEDLQARLETLENA